MIPASGLKLREAFAAHDAELLFPWEGGALASESEVCIAGEVLRGRAKPSNCPAFGVECTPSPRRSARRWSRPRARAPRTSWPAARGKERRREHRRDPGGDRARGTRVRPAVPGAAAARRRGAARPRQRRPADAGADPRPVRAGAGRRSGVVPDGRRGRRAAARRRSARVHHRRLRRAAGVLPRRQHRGAGRERHRQRPRDDGRRAARAVRGADPGGRPADGAARAA